MLFQQIRAGGDRNFGYLIGDEISKKAVVVDPSSSPGVFALIAEKHGLKIIYIIGTHGHSDHIHGIKALKTKTGADIIMHASSTDSADIRVEEGDTIKLGELELKVIHTPGHTLDSICILVDNKLLTGDTLFVGKIGGTDTNKATMAEYDSLFNKLMKLDNNIEVYPGHDYGITPTSTIGHESHIQKRRMFPKTHNLDPRKTTKKTINNYGPCQTRAGYSRSNRQKFRRYKR